MKCDNEQNQNPDQEKRELLDRLQQELATWRRSRQLVRGGIFSTGLLLLIGLGIAATLTYPTQRPAGNQVAVSEKVNTILAPDDHSTKSDSQFTSGQYSVIKVQRLDDATLLSVLKELGQPSFFAKVNGKKRLFREEL